MKINNRRYIGSKTKLLEDIKKVLEKYPASEYPVFFDAFGGTGVVTAMANDMKYKTVINDILYSNFVSYKAWFSEEYVDILRMKRYIDDFNELQVKSTNNYFANIYGDKYFTREVASKINYIREYLEKEKKHLYEREYYYLLTSLLYATDKVANTVGHFEHYLTHGHENRKFKMEMLDIDMIDSTIYCEDINKLVRSNEVECDIMYLDPPYNARQYINFYHVLENLARWNKPKEFEGKSMKFKRDELKSEYSRSKAINYFEDLILNSRAKVILLSYNNTYNARSGASNNKMKEEEIMKVLESVGSVTVVDIEYKAFQSGKTDLKNHIEKIFICEKNVE